MNESKCSKCIECLKPVMEMEGEVLLMFCWNIACSRYGYYTALVLPMDSKEQRFSKKQELKKQNKIVDEFNEKQALKERWQRNLGEADLEDLERA